jgi:hypothetical protein
MLPMKMSGSRMILSFTHRLVEEGVCAKADSYDDDKDEGYGLVGRYNDKV